MKEVNLGTLNSTYVAPAVFFSRIDRDILNKNLLLFKIKDTGLIWALNEFLRVAEASNKDNVASAHTVLLRHICKKNKINSAMAVNLYWDMLDVIAFMPEGFANKTLEENVYLVKDFLVTTFDIQHVTPNIIICNQYMKKA